MNNVLEFFVKMKDMMSGGLVKLASTSQSTFSRVQNHITQTINKNDQLANSFDRVGSKASSSGNMIGTWAKRLTVAAGAMALLSFGAGAVKDAMAFGATQKSFEVLTGDKPKGQALSGELNKLQQDTILGPGVFKNAQTMMGFGIAADKVVPTLKMLGDVSMGDAEKLNSMTLAFSQVQAAGKLTGQDLLQMINAGFNPLGEISKKSGVSIGELKKKMEEGAITSDMVTAAFQSATGAGGLYHNMLNQLAETPAGKMAQLEGQFESFKVKLGESLMPLASIALTALGSLLDIANQVLPYISEGISFIAGLFTGIGDSTNSWSALLGIAQEYVGIIWDGLSHVFSTIAHILKGVFEWIAKSEMIRDIITFIFNMITKVASVIWELIKGIATAIGALWDTVLKPILDGIEAAYKWVKDLLGFGSDQEVTVTKQLVVNTDAAKGLGSAVAGTTTVSAAGINGNSFGSLKPSGSKESGGVAKGITGGGPRVINITIGKMVEKLEIHADSVNGGLQNAERQVEELFLRILNSGATVE